MRLISNQEKKKHRRCKITQRKTDYYINNNNGNRVEHTIINMSNIALS